VNLLHAIHAWIATGFYTWAMREIDPLHPDLPRVLLRQREVKDKLRTLLRQEGTS
jgi:hypothetical protein